MAPLNLRSLHRNVIENHFSLAKWASLFSVPSSLLKQLRLYAGLCIVR